MDNNILVNAKRAFKINKEHKEGGEKEALLLASRTEAVQAGQADNAEKFLVMVTGHRMDKLPCEDKESLVDQKGELNYNGLFGQQIKLLMIWLVGLTKLIVQAVTGMANGVDTLFGLGALSSKCVEIYAAVPCCTAQQQKEWDAEEFKWIPWCATWKKWYSMSLKAAAEVAPTIDLNPKNRGAAMESRNKFMVRKCARQRKHSLAIAVWDGSFGGTRNCVNDLIAQSVNTLFVDPLIADKCIDPLKEQVLDLVRCGKLELGIDPGELDLSSRIVVKENVIWVRHALIHDAEAFLAYDGEKYPMEYANTPMFLAKHPDVTRPRRYYWCQLPWDVAANFRKDDASLQFEEY